MEKCILSDHRARTQTKKHQIRPLRSISILKRNSKNVIAISSFFTSFFHFPLQPHPAICAVFILSLHIYDCCGTQMIIQGNGDSGVDQLGCHYYCMCIICTYNTFTLFYSCHTAFSIPLSSSPIMYFHLAPSSGSSSLHNSFSFLSF